MFKMFRVVVDALEVVMCVLFLAGILSILSQPLTALSILGLVSMAVIGTIFMFDVAGDVTDGLFKLAERRI